MNYEFEDDIRPSLIRGEKILWIGKPKAGIKFRTTDIYLIPFSFLWFGFAVFWTVTASRAGAFALFGIPFVAIGFYMAIGRFFTDAYQRTRTIYAISDNRVIIKSGFFYRNVTSYNIKSLPEVTIREKSDGSGSITFGIGYRNFWYNNWSYWPGTKEHYEIEFIDNVRNVYAIIVEQQKRN
ncbi:MAG: hypothetical protein HZB42_10380 [Sphingobacteriales bacterium]|nr:hypothetical protein [Sphingobacteriales bacterium]